MLKCEHEGKCIACEHYLECKFSERKEFDNERLPEYSSTLWGKCAKKNTKHCSTCKDYRQCVVERGLPYRGYEEKNVIFNKYPNQDCDEIIIYKKNFYHLVDSANLSSEDINRKRLLKITDSGIYEPVDDDFTIQGLQRSLFESKKRAHDTFYGYARANDWEYFVTLTFSGEVVDRYDDIAVKELYSDFQRWCKRRSPDVKMLMVPERHKEEVDGKRALHFHGFVSNITFNLQLAKNAKTGKYLHTKLGDPIFNILDYKNGFSTLAVLPKDCNFQRVTNYMEKYLSKDGNVGYNQKRFYHTRNLLFKDKQIFMYEDIVEAERDALSIGLEKVKENDKLIVYRRKV